jgi:hypothetical protein
MTLAWMFEWYCSVQGETGQELMIFFDKKAIVHKELILAGQTVNSTYYRDVLW